MVNNKQTSAFNSTHVFLDEARVNNNPLPFFVVFDAAVVVVGGVDPNKFLLRTSREVPGDDGGGG